MIDMKSFNGILLMILKQDDIKYKLNMWSYKGTFINAFLRVSHLN